MCQELASVEATHLPSGYLSSLFHVMVEGSRHNIGVAVWLQGHTEQGCENANNQIGLSACPEVSGVIFPCQLIKAAGRRIVCLPSGAPPPVFPGMITPSSPIGPACLPWVTDGQQIHSGDFRCISDESMEPTELQLTNSKCSRWGRQNTCCATFGPQPRVVHPLCSRGLVGTRLMEHWGPLTTRSLIYTQTNRSILFSSSCVRISVFPTASNGELVMQ